MDTNIEIIIGTYEEFLLGYKLDTKTGKTVLTQSFADKSHSGSIRSLALQGRWIATGASDDRIFIYDMKSRKQSQIILAHDGTVNTLVFTPDETHLLSGGDDGRMIAVRLKTWATEACWKKSHNGAAVTHICCHPSGKLALSLGSDQVLRTWNLVKGRIAYKTNLKSRSDTLGATPDCLAWSWPAGDFFALTGQHIVEIFSIKTADVIKSQKTAAKPICLTWIQDADCLAGLENGNIVWIRVDEDDDDDDDDAIIIKAHDSRVKAMSIRENILVTASSSGEVKVWIVCTKNRKLQMIAITNIGCRPTCIGILGLEQFGADYTLNKKTISEQKDLQQLEGQSQNKHLERGVVTIEYEEDGDNADDTQNTDSNDADECESEEKKNGNEIETNSESSEKEETKNKLKLKLKTNKSRKRKSMQTLLKVKGKKQQKLP